MTTTTATKRKKVHWTNTHEGKKRWAAIQLKGTKSAARKKKGEVSNATSNKEDVLISYALGHVTAWVEIYAKSHGVPRSTLAYRLGKALQDSGCREVLGAQD